MASNGLKWKLRRLPGRMKSLYVRLGFDIITRPFVKFFHFLYYLNLFGAWVRKHKNDSDYIDYYSSSFDYTRREGLFNHVVTKQGLDNEPFVYMEFGVARGSSFFWWLKNLKQSEASFHGFDTFSGLPEDWGGFKKGDMHNDDQIPKTDDPRASFYKGLFQDTLPDFIKSQDLNKRLVLHLDADLYSATYYVLNQLAPYMKKGDLLFFDEFSVPLSEFKAFIEFQKSHYVEFSLLGAVNNFYQSAFVMK